jgi:uncharacterized membrane protein YphA (DoxX/SURF4 family)
LAIIAIVALRLAVGWHFFKEGATKLVEPDWTAAHFFTGSKGPLKPLFESFVWDGDGKARLNYAVKDGWPEIDTNQTIELWDQYRAKVVEHYGFDEQQELASKEVLKNWSDQLNWYFDTHRDKILEYFHGLDRRAAIRADRARQEVASLWGQSMKVESELTQMRAPWLAQVADLWEGYDTALNALATEEQAQKQPLQIPKPGVWALDTNFIDWFVPKFDFVVGLLLIVGLFTRVAALAGAGFLFSIILTQMPGSVGAEPVYYQVIEMLGMLVLAAVAAGQFAGLDFILYRMWLKIRNNNQGTNS